MTNTLNPNEEQYSFRFIPSNEVIHLTQEQIDLIPYLSVLVAHEEYFLSSRNEKGEYLLNCPIEYHSFLTILHSITLKNAYILLHELPEDKNIFHTLQLFDYFGLSWFPLPVLKDTNLIRSNLDENQEAIEYSPANLSEARQIAAQFVIGLAKNEYQLDDSNTTNTIFNLLNTILSDSSVISSSFRCHTFTIARQCSYSFFTKDQKRQLHGVHRVTQYGSSPSKYLSDDNQRVPNHFQDSFTWKILPLTIDNNRDCSSAFSDWRSI